MSRNQNIRLRKYVVQVLTNYGPMTASQIADAVAELPVKITGMSRTKRRIRTPNTYQVAGVCARHPKVHQVDGKWRLK